MRACARTRAHAHARVYASYLNCQVQILKPTMLHSNNGNNGKRNAFSVAARLRVPHSRPDNQGQRKQFSSLPDTRYLPRTDTFHSSSPGILASLHSLLHCFIEPCIPPFLIYSHIPSFTLRRIGKRRAFVTRACARHARAYARARAFARARALYSSSSDTQNQSPSCKPRQQGSKKRIRCCA